MPKTIKHEIPILDFLRGWSALAVFFHHASILGGGPVGLRGELGPEAVNAFMLASGFLIYFQSATSSSYQELRTSLGVRNFYIRRFFRIAPVYYFSLAIALSLSYMLGQWRDQIGEVLPYSRTVMSRYYIDDYVTSVVVHVSFVFGMLPKFSFSTPLPDWSLGLEMQFYLLFPLLYMGCRKNFAVLLPVVTVAMLGTWKLLMWHGVIFPMPSLLVMKFHNFAAGMALAYLFVNPTLSKRQIISIVVITLLLLLVGNQTPYMAVLFVIVGWQLAESRRLRNTHSLLQRVFSHWSSKFLADISYSLYIMHLLIMLPFFAWLLSNGPISLGMWLAASLGLLLLVIVVAYASYHFIEAPGIKWGKRLLTTRKGITVA